MFDAARLLERLNDEQRAAVTHEGGPLLVLAGAGTGKTTTLAARVAWLLATGTPPDRVLLLTFTRRAAAEMLARAGALLGARPEAAASTWTVPGGTFHAVAHRLLRRHAAAMGLPDGFAVLDPGDAADVLALVRDELGLARSPRRAPRGGTLLDVYSRTVNSQRPLSEVLPAHFPWVADRADELAALFRAYVERKRAAGLLDFDDLLLYWRAATADPELGPALAARYDHVLVDEYQDTNALQVDVLRRLRAADPRLTVVGDDAQAVYGFRAASPRHLLDFGEQFPGATTVTLTANYRSPQPVLDVANALGAEAPEGFRAVLRSVRGGGARPTLDVAADEAGQVAAVCGRVLTAWEQGVALHEQAVLVRAAWHTDLLELELTRRRVPFVKFGGLRFLEAAHVKDLLAVFRLSGNPADELAWFRVLQLLDGVGPATARKAMAELGLPGPADPARWPAACALLPPPARPAADAVVAGLAALPGESARSQAERLRDALAPLVADRYGATAAVRLGDLDALVAAVPPSGTLAAAATELALDPPASSSDLAGPPSLDDDHLVLSTVHSAKGLEWDVVHVLHATDGAFPSDLALGEPAGLEEERRLFYVAVTRPRRALHLYAPLRYHHRARGRDDAHTLAPLSRFLSPAVQRLVDLDRATVPPPAPVPDPRSSPAAVVQVGLDDLWR